MGLLVPMMLAGPVVFRGMVFVGTAAEREYRPGRSRPYLAELDKKGRPRQAVEKPPAVYALAAGTGEVAWQVEVDDYVWRLWLGDDGRLYAWTRGFTLCGFDPASGEIVEKTGGRAARQAVRARVPLYPAPLYIRPRSTIYVEACEGWGSMAHQLATEQADIEVAFTDPATGEARWKRVLWGVLDIHTWGEDDRLFVLGVRNNWEYRGRPGYSLSEEYWAWGCWAKHCEFVADPLAIVWTFDGGGNLVDIVYLGRENPPPDWFEAPWFLRAGGRLYLLGYRGIYELLPEQRGSQTVSPVKETVRGLSMCLLTGGKDLAGDRDSRPPLTGSWRISIPSPVITVTHTTGGPSVCRS